MSFDNFIHLCVHHSAQGIEYFHHPIPENFLVLLSNKSPPTISSSQFPIFITINSFPLFLDFFFFNKWNHIVPFCIWFLFLNKIFLRHLFMLLHVSGVHSFFIVSILRYAPTKISLCVLLLMDLEVSPVLGQDELRC